MPSGAYVELHVQIGGLEFPFSWWSIGAEANLLIHQQKHMCGSISFSTDLNIFSLSAWERGDFLLKCSSNQDRSGGIVFLCLPFEMDCGTFAYL